MTSRDFKISFAWAVFSTLVFFTGWFVGKQSMKKLAAQTFPRFVEPHQKVSNEEEFHVGIECPPGYDMEFIALTPKEEKEYEPKPGEDMLEEVSREEKRTNRLLNNAVCVKTAERQRVK